MFLPRFTQAGREIDEAGDDDFATGINGLLSDKALGLDTATNNSIICQLEIGNFVKLVGGVDEATIADDLAHLSPLHPVVHVRAPLT